MPHGWWLAHCISADCAMGAGIAKEFSAQYPGMRKYLKERGVDPECPFEMVGSAIVYSNVINLITKRQYFSKPTYGTLRNSLEFMRDYIVRWHHISKLAMPKIGCGLDKLQWLKVQRILEEVFADVDIHIIICEK